MLFDKNLFESKYVPAEQRTPVDTLILIGNGFDIWQNLDTSYDNSGTEWHISYYSEEDRKRIDTVMQSYGCENYTLHPDIAQCIETFKK